MSEKNIVISQLFNKKLSSEEFLKDVLKKCLDNKLLTEKQMENILGKRLELLKEKLIYYTRNESSSIMEEEAESIMTGIDFTIGLYFKSLEKEKIISDLIKADFNNYLKRGERIIKNKFEESKILFNNIRSNMIRVNNYSYDDTIEYGLSVFFSKYDIFFKPHDTPCSVDYQIPIDIMMYKGIEYIERYIKVLSYEGELCNKFKHVEIIKMLKNYDAKYEELLINIFQMIIFNLIGRIMCCKSCDELSLNENDVLQIKYNLIDLSKDEVYIEFIKAYERSLNLLNISNEEIMDYGILIISNEIDYIYRNLIDDTFQNVFITYKHKEEKEIFKYIDGEELGDSEFKKYTEYLRECETIDQKIKFILKNFKSLTDIVDMLGSDCLFGEEYTMFFETIPNSYILLLCKYVSENYSDDNYDKEWCLYLNKYIEGLDIKEKESIRKSIGSIEFEC